MKKILIPLCALACTALPAVAKFPSPELQEIYPAGGQAGTQVTVTISGEDLLDIKSLKFSHPGIKAERIYLAKSKLWDEARPDGQKFRISIPKDIKADSYDVRVLGYYGLSSPRIFQVSSANEPAELDSELENKNNTVETAKSLSLEGIANGKISKQNADYYKVSMKKGQRVLAHCWAVRLGSKLDAKLTLFDPEGNEIINNNDYIGRDPMLDFTAPKDGDYYVSVSDQTWLGSTGYLYRLKVSGKPYIETIYPAVVQKGKTSQHTLYGRNIPGGKKTGETLNGGSIESLNVSIKAPAKSDALLLDGQRPLLGFYDGLNYQIKDSNVFRLALSDFASVIEKEQDADIPVTVPSEINGRFDQQEDIDQYVFKAKKGERLWLEIFSDRQFTKSDPFMVIEKLTQDKDNKIVATELKSLDDFVKVKTQGMYDVHTYDDGIELDIAADGEYRIVVGDNFSKQGALHHYRIRLSQSKPAFQLMTFVEQFHFFGDRRTTVYPGALQLRPEGILPIRVRAYRKGGREFPIALRVEGLPKGVKALPAEIFPGEEEAYIVLTADKKIANWTGNIRIFGSLSDGKNKVEHEAVGATLNWSGTEITYGYTQRLRARRTHHIPLALLAEEQAVPITLAQKEPAKVWEFKKNATVKIPLVSSRSDSLKGAVTVMEFGAGHKLGFPFRIFVNGGKSTDLSVTYRPNSTNLDLPGEGAFILRGWADINYSTYRKGTELTKNLKTKIEGKVKEITLVQTKADGVYKKAKQTLDKQNAANLAAAKSATAKELAAKNALTKLSAARVAATKQASVKENVAKQALAKLTSAKQVAEKAADKQRALAKTTAAKVSSAQQALSKLAKESAAKTTAAKVTVAKPDASKAAKDTLSKATAAHAAAQKAVGNKDQLVKQSTAKESTAKQTLAKLTAANAATVKQATDKENIAKQTLAKAGAAKQALVNAGKTKVTQLTQTMKTADASLKVAQTHFKEIKSIEKEVQLQLTQIDKVTKETKFRAGFFSLPVRYKIVVEEKKAK
ncbi:MAG: pre-peptidase C-terminal domain-containing protein [Verrucomicrobiota bacterium]